jgi:hypothetical protein
MKWAEKRLVHVTGLDLRPNKLWKLSFEINCHLQISAWIYEIMSGICDKIMIILESLLSHQLTYRHT